MNNLNLCIKCPQECPYTKELTRRDFKYLRERLLHERFSHSSQQWEMEADNSWLYEIAKTFVLSTEILSEIPIFQFDAIDITINYKDKTVVLISHANCVQTAIDSTFSYTPTGAFYSCEYRNPNNFAIVELEIDDGELATSNQYNLHPQNIYSYDMWFPAPTIFKCDMLECLKPTPKEC